jgi:anti-anti-sigma regulatory factor
MAIKDSIKAGLASLVVGTNDSDTGPRPWVVVAALGGELETQRFANLKEDQARALYAKLLPEFEALAAMDTAVRKALKQVVQAVTRRDGRHVYTAPEPQTTTLPGVDYERPIMLLARDGSKELWWLKSGKTRYGQSSSESLPTELRTVDRTKSSFGPGNTRLGEKGGRLTIKRLLKHGDEIEAFFGWDILKYIRPGRTVLVTSPKG